MTNTIKKLINTYEQPGDFTYSSITEEQIRTAQCELSLEIPSSYLEFLRMYGHGGIGGVEILGIGKNKEAIFVTETLKYRNYGLPNHVILVENCDEWVYCIDCNDEKVLMWSYGELQDAYADFDLYLLDRFEDAAENL